MGKTAPHAPMLRAVPKPNAPMLDDGPSSLRELRDRIAHSAPWESGVIEAMDRLCKRTGMKRVWTKLYETRVILKFPPNSFGEADAALNLWYCVIEPCLDYVKANRQPGKRSRLLKLAHDAREFLEEVRNDPVAIKLAMGAIQHYALQQKARFCHDHNGSPYDHWDAASAYMMSRLNAATLGERVFAFSKINASDGTFAQWSKGELPENRRRWLFVPDHERFAFWTTVLESTFLPFVVKHFAEMLEREADIPVYLQPGRGLSGAAAFVSKKLSEYMHWRHGKYLDAEVGQIVAAVLDLRKDVTVTQVRDYRRPARSRRRKT